MPPGGGRRASVGAGTPGWYNDEDDPRLARWFDGLRWTRHTLVKADWTGPGRPPPPPEDVVFDDPVGEVAPEVHPRRWRPRPHPDAAGR